MQPLQHTSFTSKACRSPCTASGSATPKLSRHKLVYSANQRGVVSDKLEAFVPNLNTRLIDRDGNSFVYLGIVQSPYLTQHVNPARTDFDFASGDDGEVDQSVVLR